jgi:tRNA pseudouridine32 synthase/23S rRNA pseudouridine746 synthase
VEDEGSQAHGKKRKRTLQELWIDMTRDAGALDLEAGQEHLRPLLVQLQKSTTTPRKRQVFRGWAARTLSTDEETAEALFEVLKRRFEEKEGTRMDSVLTRLLPRLPEARTVHRLDCETSGALVLALTAEAARNLTVQFKERGVEKAYMAVVGGGPMEGPAGELLFPIQPDPVLRPKQMVDPADGKPSRTLFKVLEHDKASGLSRVELVPYTGEIVGCWVCGTDDVHGLTYSSIFNPPHQGGRISCASTLLQLGIPSWAILYIVCPISVQRSCLSI